MGEYDDLGLSDEEIAALEEDEQEEQNTEEDSQDDDSAQDDVEDDDESGSTDDNEDPDLDEDADPPDADDGKEPAPEDEEDDDPSEDNEADSEDDEDPDGGEESPEDKTVEPTTGDDVGEPADVEPVKGVEEIYEEKIDDLEQRLDNGKIEFDDYKKELRAIENERSRALVREEVARTKVEETWESEQATFFADNDYLKENPIVYDSFAREVNRLLEDKAWANKSGTEVLAAAKKSIDSAFGLKPEKQEEAPKKKEPSKGKKAVQKAKKASASRRAPDTLKNVPAADTNSDGAFDYLDNLTGEDYVSAVANLSDEERAAYEAAS